MSFRVFANRWGSRRGRGRLRGSHAADRYGRV